MNKTFFLVMTTVLTLSPISALAEQASFKYGLGYIDGARTSQVKTFGLRLEEAVGLFDLQTAGEIGVWTDTGDERGRRGSLYGKYQYGVRPKYGPVVLGAFWGLAAISSPDSQLGGAFPQFALDTYVAFEGQGSFVGFNYCHISSASIYLPNKGRDFFSMTLGIRW